MIRALLVVSLALAGPSAPARAAAAPANADTVRALVERGAHAEAESAAREVLARIRPGDSAARDSLAVLELLARALARQSKTAEALADAERAALLHEGLDPPDELAGARVRVLMANLHMDRSELPQAREQAERVVATRRRLLPADDVLVAQALHLDAVICTRQGEFTRSRALHEEALAIREAKLGPVHLDVAWSLNNLANVMYELGAFDECERMNRRALAIREELLGPSHADVGLSLNNLANALMELDRNEEAERMLERSLAIREAALGPKHPSVAQSLNNLALASARLGRLERADSLYARSVAIREAALGPDHPEVARTLIRQSFVREVLDHPDQALAIAQRALELRRSGLGPEHPEVALVEMRVATLLAREGRPTEASAHALRAEDVSRRHFTRMVRGLEEGVALSFSDERTSGLDLLLELCGSAGAPSGMDSVALDALVRSRALVLDEMVARQRVVATSNDSLTADLARDVIDGQARVARIALEGPTEAGEDDFVRRLAAEERALAQAQRRLAERSSSFRDIAASRAAGLPEVRGSLPAGTVLVSYVRHTTLGPPAVDLRHGEERYAAFVTRPAETRPRRVPLGAASSIDSAITGWLALLENAPDPIRRNAAEHECRSAGERVRRLLLDPLAASVAGAERVLVVPDGAISFVPFAALPAAGGGYIAERKQTFHALAVEREAVEFGGSRVSGSGLLALGGIDYETPTGRGSGDTPDRGVQQPASFPPAREARQAPCDSLATARFVDLPGSEAEVRGIASMWRRVAAKGPIEARTGRVADERAFRDLAPGRRVLHVAAHGFFVESDCGGADGSPVSPLHRGGIVLSRPAGSGESAARGDGWLTAGEIAALDLSGVEWAVLSACRTGLGEIRSDEGVFGLRRALRVAGVATVVTSLWDVEDAAVREWMEALYAARLERGLDTASSVRAANLAVLASRRARGLGDHPGGWAAFVAVGDWR
jgi:CHAT domain-containing protein/tetratricopeptide (TPR) repeat protein